MQTVAKMGMLAQSKVKFSTELGITLALLAACPIRSSEIGLISDEVKAYPFDEGTSLFRDLELVKKSDDEIHDERAFAYN